MKYLSRRNFGKAMAATAVGGLAAGSSLLARGGIAPGTSLLMASPAPDLQGGPDLPLAEIADYVDRYEIKSEEAYSISRLSLLDALAAGFYALSHPDCTKMLGPVVPGTVVPNGARVPATDFELDPVVAAFNISTMGRWLDYTDTAPLGTGPTKSLSPGHPADNLGGILASADYLSRVRVAQGKAPLVMRDVLTYLIKAYEIQGVLGLDKSTDNILIDYSYRIKIATAPVVTKMFGGTWDEIVNAASQAFVDLGCLGIGRHPPNTGNRQGWAGADGTSKGVWLALITLKGEMGYPHVLTAKGGVYETLFNGKPFKLQRPYGSYVAENVLFKPSFPTQISTQTALECAAKLYPVVKNRLDDIAKITIDSFVDMWSWGSDKVPRLTNPAAREHELQYVTAVGLIFGKLTTDDYEDRVAADPRIDALRAKMVIVINEQWKGQSHAWPIAIQIQYKDGTRSEKVEVLDPLGDPRRRAEAIPLMAEKFKASLDPWFPAKQKERILSLCLDPKRMEATPVNEFMEAFVIPNNPLRTSRIEFDHQLSAGNV
jgi:2-methylcitrate dehydratase